MVGFEKQAVPAIGAFETNGAELSVELTNGTGSPADLAFALRLKPLASAAVTEKPGVPSLRASQGIAAKAAEIPTGAPGVLSGAQAGSGFEARRWPAA